MGHFILQELLEEKLGIYPVIVKSGEKKDWPSPFKPITEEQKQYLHDKLISPAYERFVGIVAGSRPSLTMDEVRQLADGSIYHAAEALDEKLIDEIERENTPRIINGKIVDAQLSLREAYREYIDAHSGLSRMTRVDYQCTTAPSGPVRPRIPPEASTPARLRYVRHRLHSGDRARGDR